MKMYASVKGGSENPLFLQEMDRTVNVQKHSIWSPPGIGLLGCHPAMCQQVSHPVTCLSLPPMHVTALPHAGSVCHWADFWRSALGGIVCRLRKHYTLKHMDLAVAKSIIYPWNVKSPFNDWINFQLHLAVRKCFSWLTGSVVFDC